MSETEQERAGKDPDEGVARAKAADPCRPSALARDEGNAQRLHNPRQETMKVERAGMLAGDGLGESMDCGPETERALEREVVEMQARERARVLAQNQARIRDRALRQAKERIDMEQKRDGERRREWHRMVGVHREFARDYAKYRAGALC